MRGMHAAGMSERPNRREEHAPPGPAPGGDPAAVPHSPQPLDPDARPQNPPSKVKVTPLDEDRNVKDGIEVDET